MGDGFSPSTSNIPLKEERLDLPAWVLVNYYRTTQATIFASHGKCGNGAAETQGSLTQGQALRHLQFQAPSAESRTNEGMTPAAEQDRLRSSALSFLLRLTTTWQKLVCYEHILLTSIPQKMKAPIISCETTGAIRGVRCSLLHRHFKRGFQAEWLLTIPE